MSLIAGLLLDVYAVGLLIFEYEKPTLFDRDDHRVISAGGDDEDQMFWDDADVDQREKCSGIKCDAYRGV